MKTKAIKVLKVRKEFKEDFKRALKQIDDALLSAQTPSK